MSRQSWSLYPLVFVVPAIAVASPHTVNDVESFDSTGNPRDWAEFGLTTIPTSSSGTQVPESRVKVVMNPDGTAALQVPVSPSRINSGSWEMLLLVSVSPGTLQYSIKDVTLSSSRSTPAAYAGSHRIVLYISTGASGAVYNSAPAPPWVSL